VGPRVRIRFAPAKSRANFRLRWWAYRSPRSDSVKPASSGEFSSFLGGCRIARQPIRDSKRAAAGLESRGFPVSASQRHQQRHTVLIQLPQRTQDFPQQFVDYGLGRSSFSRGSMPPVTALVRCVREGHEGALSPIAAGKGPKYRKARPYLIVERAS
jgi:hypothetical protein